MDLSMAIIKADIIMAEQGIMLFEKKEIKEIKNQVAYHLQQAVEKLIKIHSIIESWYNLIYSNGIR